MNYLHTYDAKKPVDNGLSRIEYEFLVRWFTYYMDQDTRQRLMRELPAIYNKLTGVTLALYIDAEEKA